MFIILIFINTLISNEENLLIIKDILAIFFFKINIYLFIYIDS